MNNRERFLNILAGKPVDRVFNLEVGLWPQTAQRWIGEGMPGRALDSKSDFKWPHAEDCFSEEYIFYDKKPPSFFHQLSGYLEYARINTYIPDPPLEEEVIEEDERTIVFRDACGITHKAMKEGALNGMRPCMDQHLAFPVTCREDFLRLKKHYIASFDRFPENWDAKVEKWLDAGRDYPLGLFYIGEFGYYSLLRRWMGTENASFVFYDDPRLVEEMMEFMTDYALGLLDMACSYGLEYDFFHIFEDMCFNNGPLISPEMFTRFLLPQYKRLISEVKKRGIDNIYVDCDGNIGKLLPIWLDAGVNMFLPMEVKAGSDPISIRKEFGNDFAMLGGIDKFTLTKTKADIEREVRTTLGAMLPIGRYIPSLDHLVQPNVPYENFLYYLEVKEECLAGRK
ncbi:MAG: uroporphyrinogen decarboxylase family protein [Clostridiales bacterium]|nr:uroporphyrinogen decarboxylase family protein [Clostridiales bacterium]